MRRSIKSVFVMGLVALIPITLTILIVWFLVIRIGGLLGAVFQNIPALASLPIPVISLLGFIGVIVLIYLIGLITSSYIGRAFLKAGEQLVSRLPIVRTIYNAARRLTDAVFLDRTAFKKVVMIEYPRKGLYTMGFLTNESAWSLEEKSDYVNVFVPTSPNPTSGFYLICPLSEIKETQLSIDEAFRTIISGGVILPERRDIQ